MVCLIRHGVQPSGVETLLDLFVGAECYVCGHLELVAMAAGRKGAGIQCIQCIHQWMVQICVGNTHGEHSQRRT